MSVNKFSIDIERLSI